MTLRRYAPWLLPFALAFTGCKQSNDTQHNTSAGQPKAVHSATPNAVTPKPGGATATASLPAEQRATPECAAPLNPNAGEAQTLTFNGKTATLRGTTLTFADKSPSGSLSLGVLGPINEDSGENILALRRYVKFFADEKADAIVVTGDVGEVPEGIARALGELANSKLPVLVVIGNRDCQPDYAKGVAQARQAHPNVVDLTQVRVVAFPEATLVSLPGYHDPNFIQCTTGCRYYKSTLDEVVTAARSAKSPVVLVSHGPPKGASSQSIDYAASGGNVGDPDINKAMKDGGIHFGVFSNIKEAGPRATDAEGSTLVQPGEWSKDLVLNPGPANTARMDMNDHSKSYGFAAVLRVKGDEATWTPFRGKALTPAEKKQAVALEPKRSDDDEADDSGSKVSPASAKGKVEAVPQPPGSTQQTP